MFAERQAKYPKGTYKVMMWRQDGSQSFSIANLCTGRFSMADSLWDLIKDIECDLADSKYPQNGVQYRSWGSGELERKPAGGKVLQMSGEGPPAAGQPCGLTFLIKVLFRQNATWQGTIQWIEGRQTRQYRSVNELMRLMDEAAEAGRQAAEE